MAEKGEILLQVYRDYAITHSRHYREFTQAWKYDESRMIRDIYDTVMLDDEAWERVETMASDLVSAVRRQRMSKSGLDAFMVQYDLSSEEGIVLMCLAEALLRVPDEITADRLIKDKLTSANWEEHLGVSESFFVNAATWSLMLTGKVLHPKQTSNRLTNTLRRFMDRRSRPVIRRSVMQAMKILGQQYVMGETINKALKRARSHEKRGYTYSYDMLGEAARTMADADFYYDSYQQAIAAIGTHADYDSVRRNPGISVKLSALHPRYEVAEAGRIHQEMYPRILALMEQAKYYNIGLNIDAEETERLELSLEVIERLANEPSLEGWNGMGVVVQAYQKRGLAVLDYLIDLAHRSGRRFMIRLVKGAYWDSEIKQAQKAGLDAYMVFTRKYHTDMFYLACARKIFANTDVIYPQFATHNALTVATLMEYSGDYRDFEFQCLHGMGDALYDHVVGNEDFGNLPCRIYAPVGTYKHLLPYLVRRLLENGANSSFVNRITDENLPIEKLIASPLDKARENGFRRNAHIPLPPDLYGNQRKNSRGIHLMDMQTLEDLSQEMRQTLTLPLSAYPLVADGANHQDEQHSVLNPADHNETVGSVYYASRESVGIAMEIARKAHQNWDETPAEQRAAILEKAADLLEARMAEFMGIAIKEAGKTMNNAVDEVREAIDFLRYYAMEARKHFSGPMDLPGPTGESNQYELHGRGPMVCISPWNFPLAIFLGQLSACLAAGNTVVVKPAEQTSLIAFKGVEVMHEAGVPREALQYLPGQGETIGAELINDPRVAGVVFTGSTDVARLIQRTLAEKPGPIVPLIAETGGQNCMVVDSSALPEQVVRDVIRSAFDSAGQRCSALRILFLQEDVADHILEMLTGAMAELAVDDPVKASTDVGPVIDEEARKGLAEHIEKFRQSGQLIYEATPARSTGEGTFVAPAVLEIPNIQALEKEQFGPILHVVRYKASEMESLPEQINATGYGLTFGIHSRIENTVNFFRQKISTGNIYVNRDIVGAVVGVQPFGGHGLSGTGPKAGGPLYLHRLATEKSISVDTTASGGNASLMSLSSD